MWPSYVTAVNEHADGDLLLVCDVSHKVLRTDTALDVMEAALRETRDRDAAAREVLGQVVLTK